MFIETQAEAVRLWPAAGTPPRHRAHTNQYAVSYWVLLGMYCNTSDATRNNK